VCEVVGTSEFPRDGTEEPPRSAVTAFTAARAGHRNPRRSRPHLAGRFTSRHRPQGLRALARNVSGAELDATGKHLGRRESASWDCQRLGDDHQVRSAQTRLHTPYGTAGPATTGAATGTGSGTELQSSRRCKSGRQAHWSRPAMSEFTREESVRPPSNPLFLGSNPRPR
jgi:hypothetical protein